MNYLLSPLKLYRRSLNRTPSARRRVGMTASTNPTNLSTWKETGLHMMQEERFGMADSV
jgi:hypothetical protein